MKRKRIHEMEEHLNQLEAMEKIQQDMAVESKNCWWKISTPQREVTIDADSTRTRLLDWISNEIKMLKCELGLDD